MSKQNIIVVACPDQGPGHDPEALRLLAFYQGLTFINAICP